MVMLVLQDAAGLVPTDLFVRGTLNALDSFPDQAVTIGLLAHYQRPL